VSAGSATATGEQCGLSAADLELNEALIGISCALNLPNDRAMTNVLVLIQEGRRLLLNTCQVIAFSISISSTLATWVLFCHIVPVSSPPSVNGADILWVQILLMMLVTLPILTCPAHPSIFTQAACKNNPSDIGSTSTKLCMKILAARTVPTAAVCTVIELWAFGAFMVQAESSNISMKCSSQWWETLWCSELESGRLRQPVTTAHRAAQALSMFAFVLTLSVQSAGYQHRTKYLQPNSLSLFSKVGLMAAICLQCLYSFLVCPDVGWIPFELWLLIFVWPMVNLAIGEKVKAADAATHERYLNYLQLEFSTRLGMYSPR
jgi:hypothetical protein